MNKKQVVSLIRKIAQGVPARDTDLEGADPDKPKAPAAPAAVVKDLGIENMQKALVELSRKLSQRTTPSTDPNKPVRKSFADYISADPSNTSMAKALQEMQKLNDPKGAQFPIDGKWGPKTFDALDGAAKFGQAILKIASDFRLQSKTYSDNYLQFFVETVSKRNMTQKEKIDIAPQLTLHINAISSFYNELMTAIMSSNAMKQQIEGKAQEEKEPTISPQLLNALDSKYKNFKISINAGAGILERPIEVKNFADINALKAWKEQNLPAEIPLSLVVKQLKEQISKMQ